MQGLNSGLLHCRQMLLPSEPLGSTLMDQAFQMKDREQAELENTQGQEINFKYKIKIKLYVKEG